MLLLSSLFLAFLACPEHKCVFLSLPVQASMGRKRTANHPLVKAREEAETAFLNAWAEPVATQLPLWEKWEALQKQCKEQKLKGSAKEFAKPNVAQ